jgi:hypothetical protein
MKWLLRADRKVNKLSQEDWTSLRLRKRTFLVIWILMRVSQLTLANYLKTLNPNVLGKV